MRILPKPALLAAAPIACAAALAAGCGGGSDHDAPAAAAKTQHVPTLAADMHAVVAAGSPGVIALVNDGTGVKLSAAGVADTRSGRALRPTDRFRAGSNTKTLVATVVLQLAAEGKLSLDDTVDRWLPGVPSYGDRVTVRELLNMTSGVPDYVPALERKMHVDATARARAYSPHELIAMVADKPEFEPGHGWHYSTTGYVLAGLIVERATGHSVGDELERRVFEPLRMRDTYLPGATTAIEGGHSRGYGDVHGKLLDMTEFNASAGWAGGGAITTASDMARYWRGLLGGKLLAPAQLAAMKTTVKIADGYPATYGLGIQRFETPCGTLWGNGGDLPGFSSEFYNSEDGKVQAGVVVNVNPIPKAVAGEPLGVTKLAAMAKAQHREHC
jgi:D-alanyl-D-alanine carboxypeptidase